jgi:hypothetical protein
MLKLSEVYGAAVGQVMMDGELTIDYISPIVDAEAGFWILYFRVTDARTQEACKKYLGGTRAIMTELTQDPSVSKPILKKAYDDAGWLFNDAQRAIGDQLKGL